MKKAKVNALIICYIFLDGFTGFLVIKKDYSQCNDWVLAFKIAVQSSINTFVGKLTTWSDCFFSNQRNKKVMSKEPFKNKFCI